MAKAKFKFRFYTTYTYDGGPNGYWATHRSSCTFRANTLDEALKKRGDRPANIGEYTGKYIVRPNK